MAKTTSQILAENKLRRAEEAAIAASRNAIHEKQMAEVEEKNKARTAAILQKAANNAYDATTRNEMELALKKLISKQSATEEQKAEETPAASTKPKTSGASYLETVGATQTTTPYAAGILAQQKQQEMAQPAVSGNQTGRQQALYDPYAAVRQAEQQVHTPEWEAEQARKAQEAYEQQQAQLQADEALRQKDMDEYATWSPEEQRSLEQYVLDRDAQRAGWVTDQFMTAPETNAKALIDKYGLDRVKEMAESYTRTKNKEVSEDVAKKAQEGASNSGWAAAGHSVASVGANLLDTATGTMGYVNEMFDRTGRYSTLDPNNTGKMFSTYAGNVRGTVSGMIAGDEYDENGQLVKEGGKLREGLSLAYQGGMSAADSAARILASGGSAGFSAALAASGAFSQTVQEASRQGATPGQAAALGVTKAGIEYMTEKLPTEKVLQLFKGANDVGKVAAVLQQAFLVEPTSEEVSLFAGVAAEAMILRDKSNQNLQIGEMVANGMSYEEAQKAFYKDLWNEAAQTYVSSAFSGLFSSGGAAILGGNNNVVTPEQMPVEAAPAADSGQQIIQDTAAELAQNAPQQAAEPMTDGQREVMAAMDGVLGVDKAAQEAQRAEQAQQAGPSMEQLLDGVQDMTPAPAPLTEAQQHFDNAAAIANGMEPVKQEESTSVNTDPAEHTPQEQAVIEEYQNAVDENLVEYVQAVKDNPGRRMPRYPLKDVSDRAAAEIQRLTGVDVSGNKTLIEARTVEHILKRHGENGKANQSMRDVNDIGRIQYVIDNYDTVEHGGTTGAYRYQDENGKQVHSQTVLIKKKVNGTYFVVEAVPDTKKKTLYVVSAFMSKNGHKETASSLVGDAEAYRFTSENEAKSDAVLNNSIPGNAAEVNGKMDSTQQADTDSGVQMAASNDSEEYAEGGQVKGTGAAERNFSGKAAYQELLYEGNVQPDRPGDVRPMEVPKTDAKGNRVTEFAANAYGADITTDEMASTIEKLIQDGDLGFGVRNNVESLNNAAAVIQKKGAAETRNQITRNISKGKIRDGDIEQAILLYAKYNEKGDIDNASEMMVDLAQMANITGRNLQMFKLLRKMTVEGQVMTLEKEIRRNVDRMVNAGQVKKDYEANIDPEMLAGYRAALEELRNAKTPEAQEAAKQKAKDIQDAIYAAEAAKMPATFKAKWDAWRYMAMLGNVKTQARNIAGNIAFKPYKEVKDTMAALFEKMMPQDQRTKAVFQDPELMKWAKADAKSEAVNNALKYSGKLGDNVANQKLAEHQQIFDNKTLENVRKFVEKMPQKGDLIFKNDYYAKSLAGFLKARGYTIDQIQNGKIDTAVLNEARNYAIDESMKATFNDSNAFSDAIASIGRGGDNKNPWKKVLNVAAEGVLPFRRTPANILVRFTEYSPIGIAKGVWNMANHVKNGDISAATAIDQLSAGLTGTVALQLGYMLAGGLFGVKLTGSGTDEDEKRQGHQDYAIEFSIDGKEYSYTIDWAAPANLPLFIGANIYKTLNEAGADTDVSKFTTVLRGLGNAVEPMLSLSCLSSFNDLVEGIRYAGEGEAIYNMAATMATSYFTQGIPALLRQGYQATQKNKQATFANDADPTIRDLQRTAAKVPFLSSTVQTDKLNAWGEKEDMGNWMFRTFNAFANPGTIKSIDNSAAEQEINRLNEALKGKTDVTPPTAAKTFSYTDRSGNTHADVRLTEEQYQTYAQTMGQTARKIVDAMISSADYAALTDEQKDEAINTAYTYAKEKAEIAAVPDHLGYSETWMKAMPKGAEASTIVAKTAAASLDKAVAGLKTAWKNGWSDAEDADKLQWAYDAFAGLKKTTKADVLEQADTMTANYLEARSEGVSHDEFLDISKLLEGINLQADKAEAIAGMKGISEADKTLLIKQQVTDTQDKNIDDLKAMGYGVEDFVKLYRDYEDFTHGTGKKDRTCTKWAEDYGITYSAAEALYDVFSKS